MDKRVAYQGTRGSFSEMAIQKHFQGGAKGVGKITFEEVFESLALDEVDLALLPIENSCIGPIVENFDLLARNDVRVIAEVCLPIKHCLLGKKGQKLEEIKKVYSHPKALAQCTQFFREHPWMEPTVYFDTAGAAEEVGLLNDPGIAAIGSRSCAEVYGLEILRGSIEDSKNNTTRFFLLEKATAPYLHKAEGKCSLLFTLKHEKGTLSCVLQELAEHGLNLMQIVSRPIVEKPFEYLFFIDILFLKQEDIIKGLEVVKQKTQTCKLLGMYDPAP